MKLKRYFLFFSAVILFVVTYFLNYLFIEIFCVKNTAFVWQFYYFISGVTAIMLLSLIAMFYFKNHYVGHSFIVWTMLKLMAVMAYFLMFVFDKNIVLTDNVIYNIISLYLMYLIYEVFFTVSLIKKTY